MLLSMLQGWRERLFLCCSVCHGGLCFSRQCLSHWATDTVYCARCHLYLLFGGRALKGHCFTPSLTSLEPIR